jgi:S1-C subfamily serine protease
VAQAIAGKKVGERVTLTVLRDGKHVDVPVTLQPRPERPEE